METNVKKRIDIGQLFGLKGDGAQRLAKTVRLSLVAFGVLAAGFVATTGLISQRLETQRDLGSLALAAQEFDVELLQMRRNEKDYLDRKTKAELDKHKGSYEAALAALNKARTNPAATANDQKVLDELAKLASEYRKNFLAAADAKIALGATENQGLQGKLRDAVHSAEDIVLKVGSPELEAGILLLRRHEKDFILREREEYVAKFTKALATLSQSVQNTKLDPTTHQRISELLGTYASTFREFVAGTYAVNDAVKVARDVAHAAEVPVPALLKEAAERRTAYVVNTTRIQAGTTALLAVVLLGIGLALLAALRGANQALADRLAAQKKAEAENEVLNNSVISILQAVYQLSQRDLTARAPVTQDIIGTVSDSINALTDETAKVLNGVSKIAGQVATASGKVQTQAALVSKTAEDDRANVGQMIDSLATATQTMNQVATLTEQTNASATQATQATDSALETVNGTVKGMESIRETIAETEKRIKRLGERSQEISGIVNLINTISERTHVLALNASMQAAVAGEAGRGFAVVAEEVQRLAESSRNATQQIGTLVSNIQLETNETIATVNRTIGQVVQGSQQAQKAGDQMRVTQQITAQLVAQVQRIALASDEQKTMSAQLLKSVQKIGASSERTAEQITSQNVETESLLQSARRLVESVNVFKLPLAA